MKTLKEQKQKVLALIEELNPESEYLTDDPDIAAKLHYVINSVLFELARMKKIPRYVELSVAAGDTVTLEDIGEVCGREVYQLARVTGTAWEARADGTVLKIRESGTAQIDCYIYPEPVTPETEDGYTFELSPDALEIMPYGVAAGLLKSDVSADYGTVYQERYETMLERLDPRYQMPGIYVEGGVSF